MNYDLQKGMNRLAAQRRFLWKWRRVLMGCAAVVVFWTTYAMILPAITWDRMLICEVQEHTHSEACYDGGENPQLICMISEHTHTDACYDAPPAPAVDYFCGKEPHIHEEDCFFEDGSLRCTIEEHIHSESCLYPPLPPEDPEEEEEPEYFCGMEAHSHSEECLPDCPIPEHIHDESCLTAVDPQDPEQSEEPEEVPIPEQPESQKDPEYFCGMEAHSHTGECPPDCPIPEHIHEAACLTQEEPDPIYYCGMEEHTHGEDCYQDGILICPREVHVHSENCCAPVYYCMLEEHTHDAACYIENDELVCMIPEHTHSALCLDESRWHFTPRMFMPYALTSAPGTYIPGMITAAPQANEWQVVAGRYNGGTEETKVIVDEDGNVLRLRKNIVPTGVENEFYIYMTVEPVYYHDWVTIFKGSGMLVNSANNTASYSGASFEGGGKESITDVKNKLVPGGSMQGHSSLLVPDSHAPLNSWYTDQSGKDIYIDTIVLEKFEGDPDPIRINDVHLVFSFSQNSSGSFTIIYSAPNSTYSVKLSNIWWNGKGRGKPGDGGLLRFPADAYRALIASNEIKFDHIVQRTFPQFVTDPMGDHILFEGVLECSTGLDTVACDNGLLTWDLSQSPITEPSQNAADYERINVDDAYSLTGAYYLVYKVRLDVTAPGFNSAAAQMTALSGSTVYPTNGRTTVDYRTDTMNGTGMRTADFDVPAVRGLLYDISFRKLDQNQDPVPGAVFTLMGKDAEGNDYELGTITTGTNEIYRFSGLPWGTYYLTETIPDDYSAAVGSMVNTQSWEIPLCYTAHPGLLIPDTGQLVGNMLYNGGGEIPFQYGALQIINYKYTREFVFRKVSADLSPLEGAQFRLYSDEALTQEVEVPFGISDEHGVFTATDFILPEGTYYLVETVAPKGHLRPAQPGVLTVNPGGKGFRLFWNGKNYESTESIQGFHTVYSMDVVNERSVPLPATGGRGMGPITVLGILILAATWTNYFVHRKKKAGEDPAD